MDSFAAYMAENQTLAQRTGGDQTLQQALAQAVQLLVATLRDGLPLLVCGNGGSASDAMHIAGELVGRFKIERPAYNVMALSANPAILTAWSNDYSYDTGVSRQVEAYGKHGGVLWGISTSGNSPNVLAAQQQARAMGMHTLSLTGAGGGRMAELSDILLAVDSRDTPRIQEMHICIYHYVCAMVERELSAAH